MKEKLNIVKDKRKLEEHLRSHVRVNRHRHQRANLFKEMCKTPADRTLIKKVLDEEYGHDEDYYTEYSYVRLGVVFLMFWVIFIVVFYFLF